MKHIVRAGESVESIAFAHGLFWQTVWDAPENAGLREQREHPNLLAVGDEVFVPARRRGEVKAATGRRHVFRRRGVPAKLRVQLCEHGEPRAGLAYTVACEGVTVDGETDAQGWVDCWLPPDTRRGELRLALSGEVYAFDIGVVGPSTSVAGVQARLRNLGYLGGPLSGEFDDATRTALQGFQGDNELDATGELDEATVEALRAAHGS